MSDHHDESHHVVPLWQLVAVFVALLILTVVTVAIAKVDLGDYNLFVAMAVAVVKATIVAAFFMHLYWDAPFNTVALVSGILFVALFVGLSLLDVGATKDRVEAADTAVGDQRITVMDDNLKKHTEHSKDSKEGEKH